jgi:hypothetical protein
MVNHVRVRERLAVPKTSACLCRPGRTCCRHLPGVKWFAPIRLDPNPKVSHLNAALAGRKIVLNGGVVAVKALPLIGRLHAES